MRLLRSESHDVEAVTDALGAAVSDEAIAAYAVRTQRVVVTQDTNDFASLYAKLPSHPGLLLIYSSIGLAPDAKLATAIGNVAQTYTTLEGMMLALHDFFW